MIFLAATEFAAKRLARLVVYEVLASEVGTFTLLLDVNFPATDDIQQNLLKRLDRYPSGDAPKLKPLGNEYQLLLRRGGSDLLFYAHNYGFTSRDSAQSNQ
jgi:hypothetical protein